MNKISNNQMFRNKYLSLFALVLTIFMMTSIEANAQDEGESLFKSKCATCHSPHKDMTGPKLFDIRAEWEANSSVEDGIYHWVRNWKKAAATDPFAAEVAEWSPNVMTNFPELSNEEIDAIFDWVDEQPVPGAGGGGSTSADGGAVASGSSGDGSLNPIWYYLGGAFLLIIIFVGGIKRQLQEVDDRKEEKAKMGSKDWMWKNKKYLGITGFIVVLGLMTWGLLGLYEINVMTAYQPSQPIEFPHDIHAGENGIDCMYCHNSANKSRTAGLPSTNVCMNCHKMISGEGKEQKSKISKIYQSAGFSPEGGGTYSGETEPIIWNKVHNLADFVFFSHEQHVEVGGLDCKQCHGDMTKRREVAEVMPVEELNKIDGNIQLTKPTLTMGWCIECHDIKEVSKGTLDSEGGYYEEIHRRLLENDESLYSEYLEDGKVTVKELGGWDCAKCHY